MVTPALGPRALDAAAALTIPIAIAIVRIGPRRRTCLLCRRRRVVFAVAVRPDVQWSTLLDAGVTTPRCAECWGLRA